MTLTTHDILRMVYIIEEADAALAMVRNQPGGVALTGEQWKQIYNACGLRGVRDTLLRAALRDVEVADEGLPR